MIPDFPNEYFVNISQLTRNANVNIDREYEACYNDVNNNFDVLPPTLGEIYGYMIDIDVNTASCIEGINAKMCKLTLDAVPEKFVHLFATSF